MKPKNVKLGVAITAAMATLNGCDDTSKFYTKYIANSYVRATRKKMMTDCLDKTNPKYTRIFKAAYKEAGSRDSDRKWDERINELPEIIDLPKISDYSAYVWFNTCKVRIIFPSFYCNDANADGVWESASPMTHGRCLLVENEPGCNALEPADEKGDPKKWERFQRECNDSYTQLIKGL